MIFVDAGALYALADTREPLHVSADTVYRIERERDAFASSPLILAEVWALIEKRLGFRAAFLWWENIMAAHYELLSIEQGDLTEALKIQKKYRDQDFGLVDCTTFALCEKHRISKVFTFDRRHFSAYRPSFTSRLHLLP